MSPSDISPIRPRFMELMLDSVQREQSRQPPAMFPSNARAPRGIVPNQVMHGRRVSEGPAPDPAPHPLRQTKQEAIQIARGDTLRSGSYRFGSRAIWRR